VVSVIFSFGGSDKRVVAWLSEKAPAVIRALAAKLTLLMLKLQAHIVGDKLNGQVLNRRSGRLAGSIVAYPADVEGTDLVGKVEGAGGPAWYGKVHEIGGKGQYDIYPVNKKALAFFPQGMSNVEGGIRIARGMHQTTNLKRKTKAIVEFGEKGGVVVRHVVHPPLPQRAFMSPAAREMKKEIVDGLQQAANEAGRQR
jgi:hypothetical protein